MLARACSGEIVVMSL
jgi:hypothetical protein